MFLSFLNFCSCLGLSSLLQVSTCLIQGCYTNWAKWAELGDPKNHQSYLVINFEYRAQRKGMNKIRE